MRFLKGLILGIIFCLLFSSVNAGEKGINGEEFILPTSGLKIHRQGNDYIYTHPKEEKKFVFRYEEDPIWTLVLAPASLPHIERLTYLAFLKKGLMGLSQDKKIPPFKDVKVTCFIADWETIDLVEALYFPEEIKFPRDRELFNEYQKYVKEIAPSNNTQPFSMPYLPPMQCRGINEDGFLLFVSDDAYKQMDKKEKGDYWRDVKNCKTIGEKEVGREIRKTLKGYFNVGVLGSDTFKDGYEKFCERVCIELGINITPPKTLPYPPDKKQKKLQELNDFAKLYLNRGQEKNQFFPEDSAWQNFKDSLTPFLEGYNTIVEVNPLFAPVGSVFLYWIAEQAINPLKNSLLNSDFNTLPFTLGEFNLKTTVVPGMAKKMREYFESNIPRDYAFSDKNLRREIKILGWYLELFDKMSSTGKEFLRYLMDTTLRERFYSMQEGKLLFTLGRIDADYPAYLRDEPVRDKERNILQQLGQVLADYSPKDRKPLPPMITYDGPSRKWEISILT